MNKVAVVTGASSGIGAASARQLAAAGFRVWCVARRADRLTALAAEIDGEAFVADLTDPEAVGALAEAVGERCDVLVNNAGGAFGLEPVIDADLDAWRRMYELNVLATGAVTKALFPAVEAAEGAIVFVTSTAAEAPYEQGAGYCGVKAAERSMVGSLRLEVRDRPVRICEIRPGMVRTEEFSLVRLGDRAAADAVYAGVPEPLLAEDVADAVCWMATRPSHVNIDQLVIRPRVQASNFHVHRVD
ncbi:SDR family oxidoreductase [Enemella sp. A6]|uniref:SDR family oxidoreductase n=1 Tax=Enemella sp. A6 TaxID=3440152 RepID=UPI003EBD9AEC